MYKGQKQISFTKTSLCFQSTSPTKLWQMQINPNRFSKRQFRRYDFIYDCRMRFLERALLASCKNRKNRTYNSTIFSYDCRMRFLERALLASRKNRTQLSPLNTCRMRHAYAMPTARIASCKSTYNILTTDAHNTKNVLRAI